MTNLLATVVLSVLFQNIHKVENRDNIKGVHADGVSYGYVGTTQGCLDDVNKANGTEYTLKDMDNPLQAYLVFVLYTDLRCRIKKLASTNENRLRVWHAASDPAEQERYVKKVDKERHAPSGAR